MVSEIENTDYIDITPTWEEILPQWLWLYRRAVIGKGVDNPRLVITNAETEFFKMAKAADKWNVYCKESQP